MVIPDEFHRTGKLVVVVETDVVDDDELVVVIVVVVNVIRVDEDDRDDVASFVCDVNHNEIRIDNIKLAERQPHMKP